MFYFIYFLPPKHNYWCDTLRKKGVRPKYFGFSNFLLWTLEEPFMTCLLGFGVRRFYPEILTVPNYIGTVGFVLKKVGMVPFISQMTVFNEWRYECYLRLYQQQWHGIIKPFHIWKKDVCVLNNLGSLPTKAIDIPFFNDSWLAISIFGSKVLVCKGACQQPKYQNK